MNIQTIASVLDTPVDGKTKVFTMEILTAVALLPPGNLSIYRGDVFHHYYSFFCLFIYFILF